MKYKLLSLFIFALGFFSYIMFYTAVSQDACVDIENKISYENIQAININIDFLNIFINNLIVAFVLSFLGFLSGGILTSIVLFWNGYLFAIIILLGYQSLDIQTFIYALKHGPLELYALFLFAEVGLGGFVFYKKILLEKEISLTLIPKAKPLLKPISLLFIASIIEVL